MLNIVCIKCPLKLRINQIISQSVITRNQLLQEEFIKNLCYRISSFTPRWDKKAFMLFHEVSITPISLNTASRISRITSGGARNERISAKASVLIFPTEDLAC